MFDCDDDVPAGCRDADIEQAELYAAGAKASKLRKRGICVHGWCQGQPGGKDGPITCLDCGATFENDAAHKEARRDAMNS